MLIDKVGVLLKKKIPLAWCFRPSCFLLDVRSAGKLKISQCFTVFLFFFVPCGKSSVSSLGCFCCLFFLNFFVGMSSLS